MVKGLKRSGFKDLEYLVGTFFVWRILLFLILSLAVSVIPLQNGFLGGGLIGYLKNPHLWSWLNFDGEHYLSIAMNGYKNLQYFYFPIFPIATKLFAPIFGKTMFSYAVSGLLLNHITFLLALIGIWKLVSLDYDAKTAKETIILLLIFPTSFYFASFFTESLFLFFTIWSFYFLRKKRWISAGILGSLSTATRIVGLALIPAFFIEMFMQKKTEKHQSKNFILKKIAGLLLVPLGLLIYMNYLNKTVGDPLEFLNSVSIFGQQRSSSLIMPPQVFYRYIFKILPNINYGYFPVAFTTWLEFGSAILFGLLAILGILASMGKLKNLKLSLSYAVYLLGGYIIPTLSGSFSSLPRYVLVLFPAFIFLSQFLCKTNRFIRISVISIFISCLYISVSLFARGYWIS